MGTSEILFVILIGLIGVGAGIAIGVLISGTRADEKSEASDLPKSKTNMIEITTVWQERKSGRIYPEVNGKVVRYPAELSASQRDRLVSQLDNLLSWLKPAVVKNDSPPHPEAIAPEKPAQDYSTAVTFSAQTKQRISPIDMVARAVKTDTRPLEKPPQSIAAQIDEILQEKLSGTALDARAIRLMELPAKGMVIMVGLDQYPDIDAVPDEEIRTVIRESVAEWESRPSSE